MLLLEKIAEKLHAKKKDSEPFESLLKRRREIGIPRPTRGDIMSFMRSRNIVQQRRSSPRKIFHTQGSERKLTKYLMGEPTGNLSSLRISRLISKGKLK